MTSVKPFLLKCLTCLQETDADTDSIPQIIIPQDLSGTKVTQAFRSAKKKGPNRVLKYFISTGIRTNISNEALKESVRC